MEKNGQRQHSTIVAILFIFYGAAHLLVVAFVWFILLALAGEGYYQFSKLKTAGLGGPVIIPGVATTAFRLSIAKKKLVGERGCGSHMPVDIFDQPGGAHADLTA